MKDALIQFFASFLTLIEGNGNIILPIGGDGGQSITQFLSGLPSITNSGGVCSDLWNVAAGLAGGLTALYFTYECNSKWAFEGNDISAKSLAGPLLKLACALIMIDKSKDIFNGMWTLFTGYIGEGGTFHMEDAASSGTSSWAMNASTALFEKAGILQQVGFLFVALLAWLLGTAISFIFMYKMIMYAMEFVYRIGLAPLAMADAYNGVGSNSIRYLKGTFGFILSGLAFVVIPKIGSQILGGWGVKAEIQGMIFPEGGGAPTADAVGIFQVGLKVIMVLLAEIGVIGAIQQVSREATA